MAGWLRPAYAVEDCTQCTSLSAGLEIAAALMAAALVNVRTGTVPVGGAQILLATIRRRLINTATLHRKKT